MKVYSFFLKLCGVLFCYGLVVMWVYIGRIILFLFNMVELDVSGKFLVFVCLIEDDILGVKFLKVFFEECNCWMLRCWL